MLNSYFNLVFCARLPEAAGYGDPFYFSRSYKKHMGPQDVHEPAMREMS